MKKLLIIGDQEVVREGLKGILDEPHGTMIFGEAGTAPQALQLVQEQDWDAAILDLSLGGGDGGGLELLKEIVRIRPRLPVLILSMHAEEQYAWRAFKAGAVGYVTRDSAGLEMVKAVRQVMAGECYVIPAFVEKLLANLRRGAPGEPHESLSDREFEVLCLIGSGKTVGEIANRLSLSDKTISTYRARILEKMHMKTNADLMRYAIQNRLSQ